MKETPSSTKRPPALDEVSFQKLLEAAFVLQEHNQRQQGNETQPDLNASLAAIVETHNLIQTRQLDFKTAVSLVAEQAQRMTGASGVAIAIVQGNQLAYRAASGTASRDAATVVPIESAVSAESLLEGKLIQYADVAASSSPGARRAGNRGIKSLIVAPVYHKGRMAGVLELRFAQPNSFQSRDVGTAQLMAGLISEAMLVADTVEQKPPRPSEHKALLDALDNIGPDLKPAASQPQSPRAPEGGSAAPPFEPGAGGQIEDLLNAAYASTCAGCGNPMEEGEAFCGSCGTARPGLSGGASTQSKLASLWRMQQAAEKNRAQDALASPPASRAAKPSGVPSSPVAGTTKLPQMQPPLQHSEIAPPPRLPATTPSRTSDPPHGPTLAWPGSELAAAPSEEIESGTPHLSSHPAPSSLPPHTAADAFAQADDEILRSAAEPETRESEAPESSQQIRIVPDEPGDSPATAKSAWTSARKTREWLDAVKNPQRPGLALASQWWRQHRANVYVAVAAAIFAVSVVMLIVSPGHEPPAPNIAAAHRRKAPPPPEMTLFEKFLVSLGLAEPPEAPAYTGNPDTRVWVDLHTALYYCPGSELYGKTAGGKFTTQRDAQQDQFEPASRKVCD